METLNEKHFNGMKFTAQKINNKGYYPVIRSISLVFASYNGEFTLPRMLESLEKLEVNDGFTFNIIAIDNNSTDNTATILKKCEPKLPLTVLEQKIPGKNAALNKIFTSKCELGDLVIFTDDDVIFPENFLLNYKKLVDKNTSHALFGGRIVPYWMTNPSKALLEGINAVVAFAVTPQEEGYTSGVIDACKIHGPNMAVRKSVFESGIKFNENIGPNGKNYVMGSETDFLHRAQFNGFTAYFTPEITVEHMVRPWQLTDEWLKNRAYKAGRSAVHHHFRLNQFDSVALLFGYPRWSLVASLKKRILARIYWILKNKTYYKLLWEGYHLLGYCDEYKKQTVLKKNSEVW